MKTYHPTRQFFTFIFLIVFGVSGHTQAPGSFKYQSVLRDATGNVEANTSVNIEISILQGSPSGTNVFTETHAASTNEFGLITLEIGSINTTLNTINWEQGPYFITLSVDGTEMGTSQLLSVPYALYAENAGSSVWKKNNSDISYENGNVGIGTSDPVNNLQVQVDNNGVNIPVFIRNQDGTESGGNAVGIGFNNEEAGDWIKAAIVHERKSGYGTGTLHFLVSNSLDDSGTDLNDSRMAITMEGKIGIGITNPDDFLEVNGMIYSHSGGFRFPDGTIQTSAASGGPDGDTDPTNELQVLSINVDTIFLSNGGFVKLPEGFSGDYNDLVNKPEFTISPNVYIGSEAGKSNTTGYENVALGDSAMYNVTSGYDNVALGYNALKHNSTGFANIASGYKSMYWNTNGSDNIANGYEALYSNTTGWGNIANGYYALHGNITGSNNIANGFGSLEANTYGNNNIACGAASLNSNTTGNNNTGIGLNTLYKNTVGYSNVAIGRQALYTNTKGNYNTAIGDLALNKNDSGSYNTAIGYYCLYENISGLYNIALGLSSLNKNTAGSYNFAAGNQSLYNNTAGDHNIASGYWAMRNNTEGERNIALNVSALYSNTIGDNNIAFGSTALYDNTTGNENIAIGHISGRDNITGSNNIYIGTNSGPASTTAITHAVAIGYEAKVDASDKIVLGNSSIASIGGYANWSNYSDRRLKENIVYRKDIGLEFINSLKTASFNYIEDSEKHRHDGLIAQDVEQLMQEKGVEFSGLVIDNNDKKTLSLSYAEFVIPLINAVQELSEQNELLKKEIEDLKAKIEFP